MHDFNYFKPYQKVKGKTNWARLLSFAIIVAVIAFVAFDIVTMVLQLQTLRGEVAGLQARLSDPKLVEVAEEVSAAEKKLVELKADRFTVAAMKSVVDQKTVFNHDKLLGVITNLVDDAHLDSISYTGRRLNLKGTVDKDALTNVAQLVYNLRASQEFEDFNVNMISRPTDDDSHVYSFNIEFIPAEYADASGR